MSLLRARNSKFALWVHRRRDVPGNKKAGPEESGPALNF
jgi:hypothetical protein